MLTDARAMRHVFNIRVGPARFRIGSAWSQPVSQLADLYRDYPQQDDIPDFTVRLEPTRPWRHRIRPSVAIAGDFTLPDAAPLPLSQGLLAAEMAMNLQMALGWRRHLVLHASAVSRNGMALIMTGVSGSGKSTLSALLGEQGWRFLGDEFILLDPLTGTLAPFPRAVSLKNEAIAVAQAHIAKAERFGPLLAATPKGDIQHLRPRQEAVRAMDRPSMPALLLFPRFGYASAVRSLGPAETFVRLTQASSNYVAMGEPGFAALTRFVDSVPARAIDFENSEQAIALAEGLFAELARQGAA